MQLHEYFHSLEGLSPLLLLYVSHVENEIFLFFSLTLTWKGAQLDHKKTKES